MGYDKLNFHAYESMEADLLQRHEGEYVAFLHGAFVGHDPDRQTLIDRVYNEFNDGNMFVTKVGEEIPRVRLRRPFPRIVGV
ncbi:MAG: hypothetical protein WC613_00725 [Candidatus Aenigmatarchaeota archaeon]